MATTYLALLRGINVGGKNKVPMAELRASLEALGYTKVKTLIASGNVIFESSKGAAKVAEEIEATLPKRFKLDSEVVKTLVLAHDQVRAVIEQAPTGFGTEPDKYHSDVVFLLGVAPTEAIKVFNPKEGVDTVWQGDLALYSQRLSAQRTKSRLSRIVSSPIYQQMTIRNWATTTKLLALMDASEH